MKSPLLSRDQRVSILIWISLALCYLTYKEIAAFYYPVSSILLEYDSPSAPTVDSLNTHEKSRTFQNEIISIEINSADSTDFINLKIPGYLVSKILTYRNQLGGFANSFQLLDIYHFPENIFERIHPFMRVNTSLIVPLGINLKSEEELALHPYLSYKEAKAIVLYRKNNGTIHNLEEFSKIIAVPIETRERLTPYLAKEFDTHANTSGAGP